MCWCSEEYHWVWAWDSVEGNGTMRSCQCQCCDGRTWEGWVGATYWCCAWAYLCMFEKELANKACHGLPPACCDVWKCCLMTPFVVLATPFMMCWASCVCCVSTFTVDIANRCCGETEQYDACKYRFLWEGENFSASNRDDIVTGPWSPASSCMCLCCYQQEERV